MRNRNKGWEKCALHSQQTWSIVFSICLNLPFEKGLLYGLENSFTWFIFWVLNEGSREVDSNGSHQYLQRSGSPSYWLFQSARKGKIKEEGAKKKLIRSLNRINKLTKEPPALRRKRKSVPTLWGVFIQKTCAWRRPSTRWKLYMYRTILLFHKEQ